VLAYFAEHSAVWREEAARKRAFLREYNDLEGRPLALFLAAEEETGFSRSVAAAGQVELLPHTGWGAQEMLRKTLPEDPTRWLDELIEKYPQSQLAETV
jgi:hypothetical protein